MKYLCRLSSYIFQILSRNVFDVKYKKRGKLFERLIARVTNNKLSDYNGAVY